jgi:Na+/H+ antiporter NhaD/arsenite permease-like protein
MFAIGGAKVATQYIDSRNFTEPMFVFAIMVIAGTRPILQTAMAGVRLIARIIPLPGSMGFYFTVLSLVPLLGSFITEPAAMTLAALTYLGSLVEGLSDGFKYALVAGAVTGGGLTIIANAPNPAGIAILRGHFDDEAVHPMGLLLAALVPTIVAALAFKLL